MLLKGIQETHLRWEKGWDREQATEHGESLLCMLCQEAGLTEGSRSQSLIWVCEHETDKTWAMLCKSMATAGGVYALCISCTVCKNLTLRKFSNMDFTRAGTTQNDHPSTKPVCEQSWWCPLLVFSERHYALAVTRSPPKLLLSVKQFILNGEWLTQARCSKGERL